MGNAGASTRMEAPKIGATLTPETAASMMALAKDGSEDERGRVVAYLVHLFSAHPEGHVVLAAFIGHLPGLSEPLRSWLTWKLSGFPFLVGALVAGTRDDGIPVAPVRHRLEALAASKSAPERQRFAEHAPELIAAGDLPLLDAVLELTSDRSKKVRRAAYSALLRCDPSILAHRWASTIEQAEDAAKSQDASVKRAARRLVRELPETPPPPAPLRDAPTAREERAGRLWSGEWQTTSMDPDRRIPIEPGPRPWRGGARNPMSQRVLHHRLLLGRGNRTLGRGAGRSEGLRLPVGAQYEPRPARDRQ